MNFASFEFIFLFFPVVYLTYWALKDNYKWQNLLLLMSSYIFYASWDARFLSLVILSTVLDYSIGLALGKTEQANKRKLLLFLSIAVNLGILGVFKYYNFFIESWIGLWSKFGFNVDASTLDLILPLGISFYTFQTISYTVDVYRKEIKPISDFIAFGTFIAFFPQLLAGPIERASKMFPQFQNPRKFNYEESIWGLRYILWGLFKKAAIANNLVPILEGIASNYQSLSGLTLLFGIFLFTIYLYFDYSGYSDIALGLGKLLGINLTINFKYPLFSTNLRSFYQKWNITILDWFRDYIYFPLGGSRTVKWKHIRNILIVWFVTGIWHSASFGAITWGMLVGLVILFEVFVLKSQADNEVDLSKLNLKQFGFRLLLNFKTFLLFSLTVVFVWLKHFSIGKDYYFHLIHSSNSFELNYNFLPALSLIIGAIFVFFFEFLSFSKFKSRYLSAFEIIPNRIVRFCFYQFLLIFILFNLSQKQAFYYFQF